MKSPYRHPKWIPAHLMLGSIAIIICLSSLIYSIHIYRQYHTFIKNKKQSLSFQLKLFNICGIISFLLCAIVHTIDEYYYNHIYWKWTLTAGLTWELTWLFWSCGQFFSYLLFLNRLKTTFIHSIYEPSRLIIKILYTLLFLIGITWLIADFAPIYLFIVKATPQRIKINDKIEMHCSIPIVAIDVILTLSMTYMFVSRLYKLIFTQTTQKYTKYEYDVYDDSNDKIEPLLNDQSKDLIQVSVKITILTVTSLLSSVLLVVVRILVNFIVTHKDPKQAALLDLFMSFWIQIDTIISCLCFVLFLPKTQGGFKFLCCCCIGLLSKCMKKSLIYGTTEYNIKQQQKWMPPTIPMTPSNHTSDTVKFDSV